MMYVTDARKR